MTVKHSGSPTTSYATGDTVTILAGLLRDRRGTVEKIDRNGRLSVKVGNLSVLYRRSEVSAA